MKEDAITIHDRPGLGPKWAPSTGNVNIVAQFIVVLVSRTKSETMFRGTISRMPRTVK